MRELTLRRSDILKSRKRISEVLKHGKRLHGKTISLYYALSGADSFAVLIKKKAGKPYQRNRIKRWIREIYRQEKKPDRSPAEVLILGQSSFSDLDFGTLKEDMVQVLSILDKHLK